MRLATPSELPEILQFLPADEAMSIFPMSNLLALDDLQMPECAGLHITPIREEYLPLVTGGRTAASVKTMGFAPDSAPAEAERQVLVWQKANRHRILWRNDTPLALSGANAEIPQVGGVYTPPALRNRGYARRAVSMMPAEARMRGIRRALLFAANDAAARAYVVLGFRQSHSFGLTMFASPQVIA